MNRSSSRSAAAEPRAGRSAPTPPVGGAREPRRAAGAAGAAVTAPLYGRRARPVGAMPCDDRGVTDRRSRRRRARAGGDPDRPGRATRRRGWPTELAARRRGRRRGHPPAAAAGRRPRGRRSPAGWCPTSRATRPARTPALRRGARAPASGCCWSPTPGCRRVSDPGYRLVAAAVERGITVTAVPGPVRGAHRAGGVRAAGRPVLLRGLPAAQGRGAGPPARPRWRDEQRTMVFFEAPHRTARRRWPRWPRRSAPTAAARCAGS